MKRSRTLSAFLSLAVVVTLLGMVSPAQAASQNINGWYSAEPCPSTATCLQYRVWAEGAQKPIYQNMPEFTFTTPSHRFQLCTCTRGGEGHSQYVRNNAASANNKTSNKIARIYYSPNYGGNYDILSAGRAGNLYYSANDNASMRLS